MTTDKTSKRLSNTELDIPPERMRELLARLAEQQIDSKTLSHLSEENAVLVGRLSARPPDHKASVTPGQPSDLRSGSLAACAFAENQDWRDSETMALKTLYLQQQLSAKEYNITNHSPKVLLTLFRL